MRIRSSIAVVLCALLISACGASAVGLEAVVDQAKALLDGGDLQGAMSLCNQVIDARPGAPAEPKAHLLMGRIYIKLQQQDGALLHFRRVAEQFPDAPEAPEALLRAGYVADKAGQRTDDWTMLAQTYPETKEAAEALHCLGHLALRDGDAAAAAKRFEESAAKKQADPAVVQDSLAEAGFAYLSRYHQTKDRTVLGPAMKRFTTAIEQAADEELTVKSLLGLGAACLIAGYAKPAVDVYQSVLDRKPESAFVRGVAQFELGCSLYAEMEWTKAEAAFSAVLAAQPGETLQEKDQAWRAARPGYVALAAKDPDKAETLAAIQLVPDTVYWRGETLFHLRRFQESRQAAIDVLTLFPESKIADQAQALRRMCADTLGEVR